MKMSELGQWLIDCAKRGEDLDVVIRSSIGWSGVASYDTEVIGEVLIPKDSYRPDGDYDSWREDVLDGKIPLEECEEVFALCHSGYLSSSDSVLSGDYAVREHLQKGE